MVLTSASFPRPVVPTPTSLAGRRQGSFTPCPHPCWSAWLGSAEAIEGPGSLEWLQRPEGHDESPGAQDPAERLEEAGLFLPGSGRPRGQGPWLMESTRCWPAVLCLPGGPAGPEGLLQQEGIRGDRRKNWLRECLGQKECGN